MFSFSCRLIAPADRLVADQIDLADLDLRPFVHVEGDVNQLRAALDLLDVVADVGELEPLLAQHVADDALDLADQAGVDERIKADDGVGFPAQRDEAPSGGLGTGIIEVLARQLGGRVQVTTSARGTTVSILSGTSQGARSLAGVS